MKKVKQLRGYAIYQATKNDVKKYGREEGMFYIFFASDIRDYGLENSDPDWEDESLQNCIDWIGDSNYAIAKGIVEESTTCATFEEIEEVERLLDKGVSREEIEEAEDLSDIVIPRSSISDFEKKWGARFCLKHTGKMDGMISISTSSEINPNCIRNSQIDGSICQHCYALTMQKQYSDLSNKLKENSEVLWNTLIPVEEMPFLNCAFFRFEAFGDLASDTHIQNYFNMCYANSHVSFALWTKNPMYIKRIIEQGWIKPSNLNIIYSSPMINAQVNVKAFKAIFPFIDKVFTVYDKKTIASENIKINCGAKSCATCLKCYTKNAIEIINEKLK